MNKEELCFFLIFLCERLNFLVECAKIRER